MMTLQEITESLRNVLSSKRFIHSESVMKTAINLALKYNLDESKAALAGILHDCARDIKGEELFTKCKSFGIELDCITKLQPELLHAPLGAKIAASIYDIVDEEVLDAIHYHTTGYKDMSLLTKVIFIADYIEPKRNFSGVEDVRKLAYNDIDSALILALEKTIRHVVSRGLLVHPDTISARNNIIIWNSQNCKHL